MSSAEVYTESKGTSFITTHIHQHSWLCRALHKLLGCQRRKSLSDPCKKRASGFGHGCLCLYLHPWSRPRSWPCLTRWSLIWGLTWVRGRAEAQLGPSKPLSVKARTAVSAKKQKTKNTFPQIVKKENEAGCAFSYKNKQMTTDKRLQALHLWPRGGKGYIFFILRYPHGNMKNPFYPTNHPCAIKTPQEMFACLQSEVKEN